MIPVVLTIAGSDSGGGAGIQADLKTFQELKTFGTSAITAVTAQNRLGVHSVEALSTSIIAAQIQAVLTDFKVSAIKIGMLFSAPIIETIVTALKEYKGEIILDPVMIAKGGSPLLKPKAIDKLRYELIPHATVITPNLPEAEVLTDLKINSDETLAKAAEQLLELGAKVVVIKGGHSDEKLARDYAFSRDTNPFHLVSPRIDTVNTHGTGCTFSAALAAFLAREYPLKDALLEAKRFIYLAIKDELSLESLTLDKHHGPTNHNAYKNYKIKESKKEEAFINLLSEVKLENEK